MGAIAGSAGKLLEDALEDNLASLAGQPHNWLAKSSGIASVKQVRE